MASECKTYVWVPVIKSRKNASKWVDANNDSKELTNLPWGYGQPNGRLYTCYLGPAGKHKCNKKIYIDRAPYFSYSAKCPF